MNKKINAMQGMMIVAVFAVVACGESIVEWLI
jgi:hypothetical protein